MTAADGPLQRGDGDVRGGLMGFYEPLPMLCFHTVVIADNRVVTALATEHADLWRAFKGGLKGWLTNFVVMAEFGLRFGRDRPVWSTWLDCICQCVVCPAGNNDLGLRITLWLRAPLSLAHPCK
ncbi:uncharacterized protein B0I36DRAFT_356159 [Microdochium trichocladiopsis]|uniref:Uncharacterized protein n=1 Tax=Microdochium trichocladiopsis TaxID=1682393 RepID=A0A9P9BHM7_9PEZI|nr:uncharacterized protein B0I36DRAFT_356159 [Microdochium trichocladiopsis]KAH7012061.1 hypothetical protein B0I36DRAFT_356159 [Microdochium trichocladiopsis]